MRHPGTRAEKLAFPLLFPADACPRSHRGVPAGGRVPGQLPGRLPRGLHRVQGCVLHRNLQRRRLVQRRHQPDRWRGRHLLGQQRRDVRGTERAQHVSIFWVFFCAFSIVSPITSFFSGARTWARATRRRRRPRRRPPRLSPLPAAAAPQPAAAAARPAAAAAGRQPAGAQRPGRGHRKRGGAWRQCGTVRNRAEPSLATKPNLL